MGQQQSRLSKGVVLTAGVLIWARIRVKGEV
jgi:hypothetical protein